MTVQTLQLPPCQARPSWPSILSRCSHLIMETPDRFQWPDGKQRKKQGTCPRRLISLWLQASRVLHTCIVGSARLARPTAVTVTRIFLSVYLPRSRQLGPHRWGSTKSGVPARRVAATRGLWLTTCWRNHPARCCRRRIILRTADSSCRFHI